MIDLNLMTTTPHQPPAFPYRTAVATLSLAAGVAWVVNQAAIPSLLGHPEGASSAVIAAVLASWFGALMGLVPIAILSRAGVVGAMLGYFYGAAARVVMGLSVFLVATALDLPQNVLAVSLITSYLVLLTVDVIVVCRYLSALPPPPAAPSGSSVSTASSPNPSELIA